MRLFAFRPSVTLTGRTFKGLRGWAGKPSHPPLTDVPICIYVLVAITDVVSVIGGAGRDWAHALWQAGTIALLIAVIASVPAALTGLVDRQRSSQPGTQAWRTINSYAVLMILATVLAVVATVLRWLEFSTTAATPPGYVVLSWVILAVAGLGATYGGGLVFDYGFNVETSGDHPVWHESEDDEGPGAH